MPNIIEQIRQQLASNVDEDTKVSGARFFKEEIKLYGVKWLDVKIFGHEL